MMTNLLRKLRAGFTLIELLVVIAIITILAAILLPALGNARELARGASCLSNMRSLGVALQMYQSDNGSYFPTTYTYRNGETSKFLDGSGSSTTDRSESPDGLGGYIHWSAMIEPDLYQDGDTIVEQESKYPQKSDQFVCPSHVMNGFAPTNFTLNRIPNPPPGQATQTAGLEDEQAARVSYVPNESIMPRKKFCDARDQRNGDHAKTSDLCFVSANEIRNPQNTILMAEFSDSANCILGSSSAGGYAYKSHRPTNALMTSEWDGDKTYFDGEAWTALDSKPNVYKLPVDEAMTAIEEVAEGTTDAGDTHHISYINPDMHKNGSNYLFVDGHAATFTLDKTLDPRNYMWGHKVYSLTQKPVVRDVP